MNPAIIGSLLKVIGRAAAINVAGRFLGGSDREQPADPQEHKEKTLRQRLSDVVFAQTESSRSQPDRESWRWDRNQKPQPKDGENRSQNPQSAEEEDGKKSVKSFTGRLKEAGIKLSKFAGPIAGIATAAVVAHKALERMATGVLAMNKHLAQYSGNLAQTYAEADVSQMNRDVAKARAIERPTSQLSSASNAAKDSLAGPMNQLMSIGSTILAIALRISTAIFEFGMKWSGANLLLESISWVCEKMLVIMEWWYGKQQEVDDSLPPWSSFFTDVSDGKFDGKRPTFNGPRNLHSDANMKDIFGK